MSTLTLVDDSGNQYFFSKTEAIVEGIDGIKLNETVEVAYAGHLKDTPSAVLIYVLTEPTPTTAESAAAPAQPQIKTVSGKITVTATAADTVSTFTGTVSDVAMSTVMLTDVNGNTFTFSREEATVSGGNLAVGVSVSISYTGTLGEGPQATYIQILG